MLSTVILRTASRVIKHSFWESLPTLKRTQGQFLFISLWYDDQSCNQSGGKSNA